MVGNRAVGCVTYLRPGTELVVYEHNGITQKWSDSTPLLIAKIIWAEELGGRAYAVTDSRRNVRVLTDRDLAEAPND
jgi:hypothetical protein